MGSSLRVNIIATFPCAHKQYYNTTDTMNPKLLNTNDYLSGLSCEVFMLGDGVKMTDNLGPI